MSTPIVLQKAIDFEYMSAYPDDFAKIIDYCKALDLYRLMDMQQDYCPELARRLYAIIHFHHDDDYSMTCMCANMLVKKGPLSLLTKALGYTEWKGPNARNGVNIRDEEPAELTTIMTWCYPAKGENIGFTKEMYVFYDIMANLL